jgi:hypothetical protein
MSGIAVGIGLGINYQGYVQPAGGTLFTGSPLVTGDDFYALHSLTALGTGGTLQGGFDKDIYLRIPGLPLLRSGFETINSSKLSLQSASDNSSSSCLFRIYGHLAVNPNAPISYATYMSRARTVSFVDWVLPAMTNGVVYDTPDLTSIIEELMDNASFDTEGFSCAFFLQDNGSDGSATRTFNSVDSPPAAILSISYNPG